MPKPRHFLDIRDVGATGLRAILRAARDLRPGGARAGDRPLRDRTLVCVFEKNSTRTRVSFEVGARQLGGHAVILRAEDSQIGRGEPLADTARVLSRYADMLMIRTGAHERLTTLAAHAAIPVINGLTDRSHPCQIMADILTYEDRRGSIEGRTVAWCGDGNNVLASWMEAAAALRFRLAIATPPALAPSPRDVAAVQAAGADIALTHNPEEAVAGADCVITDTWVSMGDTDAAQRQVALQAYQVNSALMAHAAPDALFLHCLPAHRGEEVTDAVLDGPQSAAWDAAENRLHAQKGVMAWCLEEA